MAFLPKTIKEILSKTPEYTDVLDESEQDEVTIMGWVKSCRSMSKKTFLTIFDGSKAELQVILVKADIDGPYDFGYHDGIRVTGTIKPSPAKGQKWELVASRIESFATPSSTTDTHEDDAAYPLHKGRDAMSMDLLRQYEHLRPKTDIMQAVFRIRHELSAATHRFFQQHGFQWAHTPLLTQSDCEGAGEAFQLATDGGDLESFFGRPTYLTVSGQLHGESLALAQGRIYTFGPTFRAEHSTTSRHLAEFWMIEPELIIDQLATLLDLIESYVQYCIAAVLDTCVDELALLTDKTEQDLRSRLVTASSERFHRITYTEAIQLLQTKAPDSLFESTPITTTTDSGSDKADGVADQKGRPRPKWGDDLCSDDEKWLVEYLGDRPVLVTHYPTAIKSFYMLPTDGCPATRPTVDCVDLLVPGIGELVGGSMREHQYERLRTTMLDRIGPDLSAYEWYLDLRRFGSLPHGGFGLGFERLVMFCTGQQIRDTIPFHRRYKHIKY